MLQRSLVPFILITLYLLQRFVHATFVLQTFLMAINRGKSYYVFEIHEC